MWSGTNGPVKNINRDRSRFPEKGFGPGIIHMFPGFFLGIGEIGERPLGAELMIGIKQLNCYVGQVPSHLTAVGTQGNGAPVDENGLFIPHIGF